MSYPQASNFLTWGFMVGPGSNNTNRAPTVAGPTIDLDSWGSGGRIA